MSDINSNNDNKKLGFNKIDIDEYIKNNQDSMNKEALAKESNTELKEVVEYSENAQHSMDVSNEVSNNEVNISFVYPIIVLKGIKLTELSI